MPVYFGNRGWHRDPRAKANTKSTQAVEDVKPCHLMSGAVCSTYIPEF